MAVGLESRIAALAGLGFGLRRRLRALAVADTSVSWSLLEGHGLVDGRTLSGLSLRVQYVYLTDLVVGRVHDGGFDTLLFLDKSARPVAWLFRALWPLLRPSFTETGICEGPVPPPIIRFLNIDRMHWIDVVDPMFIGERGLQESAHHRRSTRRRYDRQRCDRNPVPSFSGCAFRRVAVDEAQPRARS